MTRNLLLASTALLALSIANPAFADEKDDRIQALEAQLQALMGEVQALKSESAQEKAALKAEVKQELKAEMQTAVNEATAKAVSDIQPAAGGSGFSGDITEFRKGDFTLKPLGRLHLDAAVFNDDAADHPDGAEFRRARLGVKGQVTPDIGYKVELDFGNEGVSFKDVYVNYTGVEDTEFRLGNFKPSFSMDNMTSSNSITFIERAAAVNAFAQSEIIGVGGTTYGKNWSAGLGLFNDDAGIQSTDDEAISVTGRVTLAPVNDDGKVIHLGAAGSYRKPDQATNVFDFDSRANNAIQSMDSVSARFTDGDNALVYGVEAAAGYGPFSAQGEYIMVDASRETPGASDLDFNGGYAQVAYTLTGEDRNYSVKKGAFNGIKPAKPFSLKDGGRGAWEIAARYDNLDVSDGNVLGGEMEAYTFGVNWYVNDYMRFMGNYIAVDTDSNAVTPDDDPQIFLFRSQLAF